MLLDAQAVILTIVGRDWGNQLISFQSFAVVYPYDNTSLVLSLILTQTEETRARNKRLFIISTTTTVITSNISGFTIGVPYTRVVL